MKVVQDATAAKAQLSAANDHIVKLEDRMKSCEERIAELERELKDTQAFRSTNLAQFTKEIKAKEEKALKREASVYVNTHSNLLAKLVNRYPEEDFSWMEKLAPEVEDGSEGELERGEGKDVENLAKEQVGEYPPAK